MVGGRGGSAKSDFTRKYPLRGYFLGVLTHTTAWDRLWGGDVFDCIYVALLHLA